MAGITTHVLDTARGAPARDLAITLEYLQAPPSLWQTLASARTNGEGRVAQFLPAGHALAAGTYRLTFDTGAYFQSRGAETFYPRVEVLFAVSDPHQHYHVPLLVAPWGYSTYRGS